MKKKKITPKIGIDCRMYSSRFTGIGRYTFELVKYLARIDDKTQYVLFLNENEYINFEQPLNKNGKPATNFTKILADAHHYSLKEQFFLPFKIWGKRLDLMHFTHFNKPILYHGNFVVTIHDLTLSFFPGNKMNSPVYRAAYHLTLNSSIHNAKKIIAVSKHTGEDIKKLGKVKSDKIRVIYEAVNEEFNKVTDQDEIDQVLQVYRIKKPYILYTGVWRNHKNLVNLIRAFHRLREHYHLDYQLVITGKEDPNYPEIMEAVASLNLTPHVVLTGLVPEDDLVALYTAARGHVLPSLYEGFGLSPLEAMKCDTPTAVSKISCIPEICGEDNALYFDPHDIMDMAEKLATLCTNEELRTELIENGNKHVRTFSWAKMARQTLEVYKEALKQ